MKYKIVEGSYPAALEGKVNQAMEQGWIPLGGVCSDSAYGIGKTMYQAMFFGGEE